MLRTTVIYLVSLLASLNISAQTLPSDSLIYDFLNAIICDEDSIEFNLQEEAEIHHFLHDTTSIFADTNRFSQADVMYLRKQVASAPSFKWTAENICGARVIPERKIKRIFKNKDGWDEFRNLYGKCLSQYSKPIFNADHTICIVQLGTQCDWLEGQGATYVFERINGNWVEIDRYTMWMS